MLLLLSGKMDICWFVIKWHFLIFHFVALCRRIIKFRMQFNRDEKANTNLLAIDSRQWHWPVDSGWQGQLWRWHDDVHPGVVTNNLCPGHNISITPRWDKNFQREAPGSRQQTVKCSEHLNWNYFNNHRNKMWTESRGKSETFFPGPVLSFIFEPFEPFLMREYPSKWHYPIFFSCAANSI